MGTPISQVFSFCPRCGEKTPSGKNPLNCESCGFSHYFSPITAVGAIVADEQGRVLFITRAKDPGKGKLGLPGGFVDAGERLEEALAREVLEETNLTATSIEYLTSFPNQYEYQQVITPVTDAFFLCRVRSFDPLRPQDGEVSDLTLADPRELDLNLMAFESNRLAVQYFLSSGRTL